MADRSFVKEVERTRRAAAGAGRPPHQTAVAWGRAASVFACAVSAGGLAVSADLDPATLPEVTVSAPRAVIERRADRWVTSLTARQSPRESLSRWSVPVCPLVAGLPRAAADVLLYHLTHRYRAIGAAMADEHCREPNLYVIATTDPVRFLHAWARKDARLYGGAPPRAIDRFVNDPRPIRVWRNVTHDSPGAVGGATDLPSAGIGQQFSGARATQSYIATRLAYTEVRVYDSELVLVDLKALEGVTLATIADYVTLVTAAEVDPDVRVDGVGTVLSLVRRDGIDPSAPTELTPWDLSFLTALYATDPRETMQRAAMTERMVGGLTGAAPHQ